MKQRLTRKEQRNNGVHFGDYLSRSLKVTQAIRQQTGFEAAGKQTFIKRQLFELLLFNFSSEQCGFYHCSPFVYRAFPLNSTNSKHLSILIDRLYKSTDNDL